MGGDVSADIFSLPHLVTLRSKKKLSDDSRLTSKQSVKLAAVERAMHQQTPVRYHSVNPSNF